MYYDIIMSAFEPREMSLVIIYTFFIKCFRKSDCINQAQIIASTECISPGKLFKLIFQ